MTGHPEPETSASPSRERAGKVLIVTLAWAGLWAWTGLWYAAAVQVGRHPKHYDYIPWWGWAAFAGAPLVLGSLIVIVRVAMGRL